MKNWAEPGNKATIYIELLYQGCFPCQTKHCHSSSTELSSVFSEDRFPTFFGWIGRMKQTDAVKKSMLTDEAHLAFIKSFKEGKHDYSHADLTGEGVTIYTKKQD